MAQQSKQSRHKELRSRKGYQEAMKKKIADSVQRDWMHNQGGSKNKGVLHVRYK